MVLSQDALSHYDENLCEDEGWGRGGFVVIWGVKVTPESYFDIQKTQLILELKYRQLKQILNDLFFHFILFILGIG